MAARGPPAADVMAAQTTACQTLDAPLGRCVVARGIWLCAWILATQLVVCGPVVGAPQTGTGTSARSVRVAILAADPSLQPAADLLTVQFAKQPALELLERTELQKVYREQELAEAASRDYLKLGQILGADGLCVLSRLREGTNAFLQARLLAVKPGVVLESVRAPWPLSDLPGWAELVPRQFRSDLPKLSVLAKDAVPISVLNLRSSLRTPQSQELERELTLGLIHRLAGERELFVLERRNLREAAFEQTLKPEEDSAFWTGRYLLDGTLDKNGYAADRVTISARLVSPRGGAAAEFEVSGPREDRAGLVESLTRQVLAQLNLAAGLNDWRPEQEAGQFEQEAQWAYRWRMLPEAQAASESAWALGLHGTDVARLRIQAYSDDIVPEEITGGIEIPGIPNPSGLGPAIRALELFCQAAPRSSTNGPSLNCQWYELGLKSVRHAAGLLDGFYEAAELRTDNEQSLAQLRAALRATVAILQTNNPDTCIINSSPKLEVLEWEQGGTWYERPEDSLAMFREVLRAGYAPSDLPRLAGWSWENRKKIPGLMVRFIEDCLSSPDLRVRFEAMYLSILRLPLGDQARLAAREPELIGAMWEKRDLFWTNAAACSLLTRAEEALALKHGFVFPADFHSDSWSSLRRRLRKEYLIESARCDNNVARILFPDEGWEYSRGEVEELLPALRTFKQKFSSTSMADRMATNAAQNAIARLERLAPRGQDGQIAKPPLANPRAVAAEPSQALTSRFIAWKLARPGIDASMEPDLVELQPRGGRIWFAVRYHTPDDAYFSAARMAFVGVDPRSGKAVEVTVPATLGFADGHFDVSDDSLFASLATGVARYRFKEGSWDTIAAPLERGARIVWLNQHLYLATADSLLELDPGVGTVRVVASSRRRPSENALDSAWRSNTQIWLRRDGKLGVLAGSELFAVDPRQPAPAAWATVPGRGYMVNPLLSDQGAAFLLRGTEMYRHRLVAYWNGSGELDCLLDHLFKRDFKMPGATGSFTASRWDWPQTYLLECSCIWAEPDSVWVLTPRKPWREGRPAPEEPMAFADDRQATLFRFQRGSRPPVAVAVRFEKDAHAFDPFDRRWAKSSTDRSFGWFYHPFWINTAEGLVMACPPLAGHWLIPQAQASALMRALGTKNVGGVSAPETGNTALPAGAAAAVSPGRTELPGQNQNR